MGSGKNKIKSIRDSQRSYLNRDFDSFRSSLTQYSRTFFSDKISDFSENGFAGMLIELTSYVGDVMSYYMDHQFQELSLDEASETSNIERLIRNAGVKIVGASPAIVEVEFYMEIPAKEVDGTYVPDPTYMPIIRAGTTVSSGGGITFTLADDIDMGKKRASGELYASYVTMKSNSGGDPTSFSIMRSGTCISSANRTETFAISNSFVPFRTVSLGMTDITEIISVIDSDGNEWYEVEALTRDTVYRRVINTMPDRDSVAEELEVIPAPRRFVASTSSNSRKTTLRFGGGSALSTDDDVLPDPSELSLPLYGKRTTITNFTIDPNKLLSTTTLGVAPQNTVLTVRYRYGGGVSHNVSEGSIRTVRSLITKFNSAVSASYISSIRASLEVINRDTAKGGERAPTINEMRTIANLSRNSQNRMVTKDDLIARIYTMPSKFGRVFRVGIRSNPHNPLAAVISIISRDKDEKLVISSDTLKSNLKTYLNESRLISDAIDIVDAAVLNVGLNYSIAASMTANTDTVIQKINTQLKNYFEIENFQIGTPIITTDIVNLIINTPDVQSLVSLSFYNISGTYEDRVYSNTSESIDSLTNKGIINCPPGSIFEFRFPEDDIIGTAG